jgi:acylphosphatase
MRIIIQGIVQGVGFRRNFFFLHLAALARLQKE